MTDQEYRELHTLRTNLMGAYQWALKAGRYGVSETMNGAIHGINSRDGFLDWVSKNKPSIAHIDMGNTEAATAALNLFAKAAERATAAIEALGKSQHGGVTFVSGGDVAKLDVKASGWQITPAIPWDNGVKPRTVRDEMGPAVPCDNPGNSDYSRGPRVGMSTTGATPITADVELVAEFITPAPFIGKIDDSGKMIAIVHHKNGKITHQFFHENDKGVHIDFGDGTALIWGVTPYGGT